MKSLGRILLSAALLVTLFSGCTTQPKIVKEEIKIDPTLPVVSVNGYLSDMNAVAFEWKSTDDSRVAGVYIYRSSPEGEEGKLKRIDAVKNRFATHYTDTTVIPDTSYQYRFSTYDKAGAESNAGTTHTVRTLPVLTSVSFFASISDMPRSAKLIWRPHTNVKVKSYRIERQSLEDSEWMILDTINGRLSAEYIDLGLKDDHIYKYRLRAVTYDNIVSTPSEIIQVATKPLPKPVRSIEATTSLPKKVVLNWEPNEEKDLDYYNIYRGEKESGSFDLRVTKLRANSYSDPVGEDGKLYFYKITAVDKDGLESLPGTLPVAGSALSKPKSPIMTGAKYDDNSFRLHWKKGDPRTVSYVLIKTTLKSWISKSVEEITAIKDNQFTDIDIVADTRYEYQVVAVDKNGIRSEPTKAVELSFTKAK